MPEHTFPLRDRTDHPIRLTDEEAVELNKRGFQFSIFRPGREQSYLSLPYETTIDRASGTITIRQPEGEGVMTIREPEQTIRMRAEG